MKKLLPIAKARREYFGGIVLREHPAFLAYINKEYADTYNIPEIKDVIFHEKIFTAPIDAHFTITTNCNMYCSGCYSTRKEDEPKNIPMDLAKTIIDKLSDLGVFSVSFGGGEPSLHPGIFELADYTRKKNILPNMTTNGLAMTSQLAVKYSIFGNVHFSIHKLQDLVHVLPACSMYHKTVKRNAGLNILITSETLSHLDEILHLAVKSKIKKVLFLRYKKTVKNIGIQELDSENELIKLPELFKKIMKKYWQIMFLFDCSLFELLAENNFSDIETYYKYDNNGCQGGNSWIAIDINGMYKPCSFWHESFGSILDLDFHRWIYNPQLNEFRNMKKKGACTRCGYDKLCNGGCRLFFNA